MRTGSTGNIIIASVIRPPESKVDVVRKFPTLTTLKHLREFLSVINFPPRVIPCCAHNLRLLTPLLRKDSENRPKLNWSAETEIKFNNAWEAFARATLVANPQSRAPTRLITNAYDAAVGAVLQQFLGRTGKPSHFCPTSLAHRKHATSPLGGNSFNIPRHQTPLHLLEGCLLDILTEHCPFGFAYISNYNTYSA